jgi:hypothetical protein
MYGGRALLRHGSGDMIQDCHSVFS